MSRHWTYAKSDAESDLQQGDVLAPTKELREVLEEVHPHFLDPKYTAFMVLSQSCDLIRRGRNECSAHYLAIGVVRSLSEVLDKFIGTVCSPAVADKPVYLREQKIKAKHLLQRILNQNEQALGLFYLHPLDDEKDSATPLVICEACVCLLRVSVALRAEHYDVLREARCARLDSQFQHKLGWLVGYIYGRIGTDDWTRDKETQREMENQIKRLLGNSTVPVDNSPIWVDREAIEAAQAKGLLVPNASLEEISNAIESCRPAPVLEQAASRVEEAMRTLAPACDAEVIRKVVGSLKNDKEFRNCLR